MSTMDTIGRCDGSKGDNASIEKGGLLHTISAAFGWFGGAMLKRRTRMHLSELSNDLLDDIGVSPAEARREIKRFFWD
jgi:uncharacterized protein YjiS (DUF1127 family)